MTNIAPRVPATKPPTTDEPHASNVPVASIMSRTLRSGMEAEQRAMPYQDDFRASPLIEVSPDTADMPLNCTFTEPTPGFELVISA